MFFGNKLAAGAVAARPGFWGTFARMPIMSGGPPVFFIKVGSTLLFFATAVVFLPAGHPLLGLFGSLAIAMLFFCLIPGAFLLFLSKTCCCPQSTARRSQRLPGTMWFNKRERNQTTTIPEMKLQQQHDKHTAFCCTKTSWRHMLQERMTFKKDGRRMTHSSCCGCLF